MVITLNAFDRDLMFVSSVLAYSGSSTYVPLYWMQRRPEIHLFAARYREQQGDVKGARASYEVLRNDLGLGLLEAIIKHANFEKRQVSLSNLSLLLESFSSSFIVSF